MKMLLQILLTLTLTSNWLTYIEEHEGISLTSYVINEHATIGYGHINREGFTTITQAQADSLIIEDYLKALSFISKRYPHLSDSKKQALAHYVYARGVGNFTKSELAATLQMQYTDKQLFNAWVKASYIQGELNTNILYNRVTEYINYTIEKNDKNTE